MPFTARTKKYTDYGYLETDPASEDAVRTQMDGAVDEVFEIMNTEAALKSELGTLSSLTTTAKTSAVAAINEVDGDIGVLSSLLTTAKTNIVSAVNELFNNKANKTQQSWVAPTLINSWVNYGAPAENSGYFKDDFGVVHLKGLIKNGLTSGNVVFNLPIGYRPSENWTVPIITNTGLGHISCDVSGIVAHVSGGTGFSSLSGITFKAV